MNILEFPTNPDRRLVLELLRDCPVYDNHISDATLNLACNKFIELLTMGSNSVYAYMVAVQILNQSKL